MSIGERIAELREKENMSQGELAEALEVTRIHSVAGLIPDTGLLSERPFRSPHHTASHAALVGGGASALPGEVSKAHNGVLFLCETLCTAN